MSILCQDRDVPQQGQAGPGKEGHVKGKILNMATVKVLHEMLEGVARGSW